jgi:ABC-type branched-subunit amino acid transport system ATPase component
LASQTALNPLIEKQPGSFGTNVGQIELRPPSEGADSARLRVAGIRKSLGGAEILKGITLEAKAARITGLIGPNGAGKSTILNVVGGLLDPDEGQILLGEKDLTSLPVRKRALLGMVRTFQLSRELGELTVLENLLVARPHQTGERAINAFLRRWRIRKEERASAQKARQLLRKVGLWDLADAPARTLSGGQKKLLELSRALMLDPKIILLDEPVAGVSPPLRLEISALISDLRDEGRTLVIVEHDMDVVARLCDFVYVISEGVNLTQGKFKDVVADDRVIRAYLGGVA